METAYSFQENNSKIDQNIFKEIQKTYEKDSFSIVN